MSTLVKIHRKGQMTVAGGINAIGRANPWLGDPGRAALPSWKIVKMDHCFLALGSERSAQKINLYLLPFARMSACL